MAIAQAAVVFQWLSLGAFAAILIVAGGLLWRRPEVRLLLVFPAAWGGSGALLYIGLFTGVLPGETVFIWSAAHRFVAAIMILAGLLALCLILSDDPPDEGLDDGDDIRYE